jgi:hypothetical protein
MKKILTIALLSILVVSCTDNSRVRYWGGEAELKLPKGYKLINVTWKDGEIWYLTKPMKESDSAEIYHFQEKSGFGLSEGVYTITEKK